MKLGRFTRIFLLGSALLLCLASAFGNKKEDTGKRRAKARYFYLKGAASEAQGNIDEAYEYFKKAFKTDPEYTEASYAFGLNRSTLMEDTFSSREEFLRDLSLMRPLLDQYPGDVASSERYAYAASFADTLPEGIRVYNILIRERPGLSRLYMPLSYYYLNTGKADSAVFAIRELERLEGSTTETTIRKATAWLSVADTLSALAEARAYAESNPGRPEPIMDKAMIYGALGQPDSAIIFLEDALRQYPDRSEVKFDIALFYAEKGDSAKFHSLVDEAFRGEDMEYEDRMGMLDVYIRNLPFGSADYTESDRLFEYAASLYPDDADFFDQYTNYEITKKDYSGAFEKAKKSLELNPREPTFFGRVISLGIVAGNPRESMEIFEKFPDSSLKKDPNIRMSYIGAAQIAEEYDKALENLDSLISNGIKGLGLGSKLKEEIVDSLEKTENTTSLYYAGVAYEVAGDIYAKTDRIEDAMRSYENSITILHGTSKSALNNYAYYLVEKLHAQPGSEEFEKAKRMSRETLDDNSDMPNGTYLDTYAWILYKEGDYGKALEYQQMAIEAEGEEAGAEMLDHYGDILYMNDRKEEALEQWKKALELEPDNKMLQQKVERKALTEE